MRKVITYQAPSGQIIDLTRAQVDMLETAGKWPRTARGEEYCTVSHGLHVGEPTMTDDELRADVGIVTLDVAIPYTPARIAWELDQTALGNAYYGNALYVSKGIPALSDDDRACLDRWLTGCERGVADRVTLQDIAIKVRTQTI